MSLTDAISHGPFMTQDWSQLNKDWGQYLDDHVSIIQRQCIAKNRIYQLTADMIQTTKFSIPQYLRYQGMDESLAWIIRKLNSIPNDWYFTFDSDGSPPTLYIPDVEMINEHYQNFLATKDVINA